MVTPHVHACRTEVSTQGGVLCVEGGEVAKVDSQTDCQVACCVGE